MVKLGIYRKWNSSIYFYLEYRKQFIDNESSKIENLYPGTYSVSVTDTMGCTILDSITIQDNPKLV